MAGSIRFALLDWDEGNFISTASRAEMSGVIHGQFCRAKEENALVEVENSVGKV